MTSWKLSLALCASLLLPVLTADAALPMESQIGYYIDNYGLADPDNPQIQRAHAVFERVRRVADRNERFFPALHVIESTGDPWVIALPDGNIVLTRRAVEIAYRHTDERIGDARMAFMLGHELAHLSRDHYWHHDVFRLLTRPREELSSGEQNILQLLGETSDVNRDEAALAEQREKEHEADDRGFIYAALAGYAVDTLLADAPDEEHFFTFWMSQTQTRLSSTHPHPEDRAALLQTRLNRIDEALAFYRIGVRLTHFQRYGDALHFLKAFQSVYPGREVMSNLGYVHLQLARHEMGPEQAYHFCLPTLLDTQTRAAALVTRGQGEVVAEEALSPVARQHLEQAVAFFQRAAEADPQYLPAYLNLTTAHLYLGDVFDARAAIEKARTLAPDDSAVANLRALTLYRDQQATDMWPYALAELERVTEAAPADSCARFNLAQLLEARGRQNKAQTAWGVLADQLDGMSRYQQAVVCDRVGQSHPACIVAARRIGAPTPELPWTLPVDRNTDLLEAEALVQELASGETLPFDWGLEGMAGNIYHQADGTTVLDLDSFVEMVILEQADLGTVADLESCCGIPTRREAVVGGEIWNYGNRWAALVQDGQVREVWVVRS